MPVTHVRLWEGRCADGREEQAAAWVQQVAAPDALEAGAVTAEVFRSDGRIVLLTRWTRATPWVEPVPPAALIVDHGVRALESVGDR